MEMVSLISSGQDLGRDTVQSQTFLQ
ncbi:hypothetical protein H4Q32_003567 [Labeo rohita]|uniref:Uncharacterized protein n=1 Tax=Labeo rohita TaxID=84645 RepID=A0ABQ8MWD3_LABRO|nr:hypothetical protein H4Q32_003567 [Labeo rohita]